jgi:hypothetical protein
VIRIYHAIEPLSSQADLHSLELRISNAQGRSNEYAH